MMSATKYAWLSLSQRAPSLDLGDRLLGELVAERVHPQRVHPVG
jgi:hypothetical protein